MSELGQKKRQIQLNTTWSEPKSHRIKGYAVYRDCTISGMGELIEEIFFKSPLEKSALITEQK